MVFNVVQRSESVADDLIEVVLEMRDVVAGEPQESHGSSLSDAALHVRALRWELSQDMREITVVA